LNPVVRLVLPAAHDAIAKWHAGGTKFAFG